MDADTLLDEHFVENAYAKYQQKRRKGHKLGGVCANFHGLELDSALGVLQKMEYARAEKINRSRRGIAPVLAGAATMFSVRGLREVHDSRGRLYEPVLTEDYELSLALRVHGYETMAPRNCFAHTDLMPTVEDAVGAAAALVQGRVRVPARLRLSQARPQRHRLAAFSLWAAASRWLFLVALAVVLFTAGHMSFSPLLLPLFAFASVIRMVQVKELGWKYVVLAGVMVEELYYAFFLEAVLWRSAYLAFFAKSGGNW